MTYTAIMDIADNRVAKFMDLFETEEAAQAHVDDFAERWPNAFVVDADVIPGPMPEWWVEGKTVTVVPLPEPEPEPEPEPLPEPEGV